MGRHWSSSNWNGCRTSSPVWLNSDNTVRDSPEWDCCGFDHCYLGGFVALGYFTQYQHQDMTDITNQTSSLRFCLCLMGIFCTFGEKKIMCNRKLCSSCSKTPTLSYVCMYVCVCLCVCVCVCVYLCIVVYLMDPNSYTIIINILEGLEGKSHKQMQPVTKGRKQTPLSFKGNTRWEPNHTQTI